MILETPYAADIKVISGELSVDFHKGLSEEEAQRLLSQYGPNTIQSEKQKSLWQIFFVQFKSPMVLLLLVAAGLSFYFQEYLDAIAILIVILITLCLAIRSMPCAKASVATIGSPSGMAATAKAIEVSITFTRSAP